MSEDRTDRICSDVLEAQRASRPWWHKPPLTIRWKVRSRRAWWERHWRAVVVAAAIVVCVVVGAVIGSL